MAWVQGQNLDRAGTCPCTDPQEYLMVQGHSSDQTQAWCRATPVDQNGASERSELALFWSTGVASRSLSGCFLSGFFKSLSGGFLICFFAELC